MDCKEMIIHFEDLHQHVQFRIAKAHGVNNPIDFKNFFKLNPIVFTHFCKENNKSKEYGKVRFWMVNPLFKTGKIKDTNLEFVLVYSERDKVYRRYIIRQKEE